MTRKPKHTKSSMTTKKERCGDCRFALLLEDYEEDGETEFFFCRRYPPSFREEQWDTFLCPVVSEHGWCGEWKGGPKHE